MRINIGIDIDGVITDEGNAEDNIWHRALTEHLGTNIKRKKDVYDFTKAYGLSRRTIEDFIEKNIVNIYQSVQPLPGVRETLLQLKENNFFIFLITARNEKHRSLTSRWLNDHSIPYDILIHEDDKAPLARNKGIKLFIEDNKQNALELLEHNIPVLLFNRYHNRECRENYNNLYRVNNWQEIQEYIYKIFKCEFRNEDMTADTG